MGKYSAMLYAVKWSKFKLEQLFKIQKVSNKLYKKDLSISAKFPVYSSESNNGGVMGFTNAPEFICDEKNPFYIIFGDHTKTFNIAQNSFSVMDNVKVLRPYFDDIKTGLFIISVWRKQIPNLGYARHWKVAKGINISLPVTDSGAINFDFIRLFMSEIENDKIKHVTGYFSLTE